MRSTTGGSAADTEALPDGKPEDDSDSAALHMPHIGNTPTENG